MATLGAQQQQQQHFQQPADLEWGHSASHEQHLENATPRADLRDDSIYQEQDKARCMPSEDGFNDTISGSTRDTSCRDCLAENEEELNKNRRYVSAGPVSRALPSRFFALLVTLLVEVPVALIISSGSTDLKLLLGGERYTLLMAFLPLTSAISGNVGLQASSLTTRAISHGDCTKANSLRWMQVEVLTAIILACLTGSIVGMLAGVWTGFAIKEGVDVGFALTVGLAQAFSMAIAGVTGTLAPLIFSFFFKTDAGKWAGPLETAIQDIAGSFAMVYLAQALLVAFVRMGLSPAAPLN